MKKKLLFLSMMLMTILFYGSTIDLNNLYPYASQNIPTYITKENGDVSDNALATLGRVLFYDKNLSNNNSISCSSCHQQEFAFGDTDTVSIGLHGGFTERHSMRLVNARFADEERFFWNERAANLEEQVTQPIQDHIEMGFSGTNGQPNFDDLISKLEDINYYQELFNAVYNDQNITEPRIQEALSHFIRSIQSFDSRYDQGRVLVNDDSQDFPNFIAEENEGKALFLMQ